MRRGLIALVLVTAAIAAADTSQMPEAGKVSAKDTLVYIGSYTTRAGLPATPGAPPAREGKGIYLFRLQSAGTDVFQNVTLVPLGLAIETANPSHLEIDSTARRLFAVNEIDQFDGKPTGAVSAFAIDPTGKLTLIGQRASMGARPCHLALAPDGRHVLVANCGGTAAVLPIAESGALGEATDSVTLGPSKALPGSDAAACVAFDPGGTFAFVCDAGASRVLAFSFDRASGKLAPAATPAIGLKAGAVPRQIRFRPDARFAYVLDEKSSTVTVFAYDASTGTVREVQTVSSVPEYFGGENQAGEMHLHRTGKWLYVSNVGHNSVVLFTVDAEKGTLAFVEEQGTGGRTPRQFGLEPSAKHLAISNRDSDSVLASRIDDGNGRLKPSGIFAEVPSPAAIRFLPPMESGR
jgi:6-phosphogluconolactonase